MSSSCPGLLVAIPTRREATGRDGCPLLRAQYRKRVNVAVPANKVSLCMGRQGGNRVVGEGILLGWEPRE